MARSVRGPGGSPSGVLRMVERTGMRKGMSGSKGWFYVGTGLWTMRTIRRLAGEKEEIIVSERLKPGQRMIIANGRATIEDDPNAVVAARKGNGKIAAPSRRARRKQAKADAKAAAKAAKKANKKAAKKSRRRAGRRQGAPAAS